MMNQSQTILAGLALALVGILTGCLIFHAVPQGNQQLVTFALGGLIGALTAGGASKLAEKIGTAVNLQDPPQP